MKKTIIYPISSAYQNMTVDRFLREQEYSASLIRRLKTCESGLTIGGSPVYTIHQLQEGEILTVTLPEESPSESILPVPMDLDIRYEDEDIMVINKPSGVPVHPSMGNYDNTLAGGVTWYWRTKSEHWGFHAVNRLDKDTTGLLILAKHSLSACILSEMVRARSIRRYYIAIAMGKLPDQGIINAPIARTHDSTIERCVDFQRGEEARTHYLRLFYDPVTDCSMAAVKLDTGRTHQIRVHFHFIGHPLPGDFLYCPNYRLINRQALHSFRLEFLHPLSREPLIFEAPLPTDMGFLGFTSIGDLWDSDF